jgi:hypothetical protein
MAKPKKVLTPGSYAKPLKQNSGKKVTLRKKKMGRPAAKNEKPYRQKVKHTGKYSEADMKEAVCLVMEDGLSNKAASKTINDIKVNEVPHMTLNDRMRRMKPAEQPAMGRPQELDPTVEEALVVCLEKCSEFQYPMKKRDLQDLVQSYCIEHSVQTRWKDDRPAKDWIRNFQKCCLHRVRVRKPSNIKRSRAKVSPEVVRGFFGRLQPNLEGIPATHIFNYDESPITDDPQAEDTFFSSGLKYHEQVTVPYITKI